MSVRLRLKRLGSTHRPYYRVVSVDQRRKRDGAVIEELGTYDPTKDEAQQVNLKADRCQYWLNVGAQPSETVAALLRKAGLEVKLSDITKAQRAAVSEAASRPEPEPAAEAAGEPEAEPEAAVEAEETDKA